MEETKRDQILDLFTSSVTGERRETELVTSRKTWCLGILERYKHSVIMRLAYQKKTRRQ